jgi:hypothetical protein
MYVLLTSGNTNLKCSIGDGSVSILYFIRILESELSIAEQKDG